MDVKNSQHSKQDHKRGPDYDTEINSIQKGQINTNKKYFVKQRAIKDNFTNSLPFAVLVQNLN